MKKLLGTLFAATLVLSACSQDDTKEDENKKSESTTEKKANDKKDEKTKEDKKSKEEKKSQENEDNKSTEEQNTQENATNEQRPATQEQEQQSQQSQNTQQSSNNQNQYSDEYLANNPVSTDGELTPEEQQRYDEGMRENEQNNHVDLNSLPPTDFDPTWMSESGQKQVNDLAEQKDNGQISQYEFNDRVSDVMNNEMDNQ